MTACTHCKLEYSESALKKVQEENGEILYFCCHGCELAYSILKESNLESFYAKLGDTTLKTKSMQDSKRAAINYDSINFTQKYLKDVENGYKEAHVIIEGIACAACVWLNEQIIAKIDGVQEIQINYTTHKAKIIFDSNKITFKQIHDRITKIGYNIIVYDPKDKEEKESVKNRIYYIKLVVAIFCTMNIMWVNVGQYSGFFVGIDSISSSILNLASFILATPVLFFCASDFYVRAFKGLRHGVIGMDLLVITGTSLVYCYSIYAWLSQSGHTYFESVCMIILFVLGAKFLESLSQKVASDNLHKLNAILPLEARRENGEMISVYDVCVGDRLLVLSGEMLCVDGILESEEAYFDYANISGESAKVRKKKQDSIMAGAIALEKPVLYKAQKSFQDSSMSKLVRLLKESGFSAPEIATSAFQIAGTFSRVVLTIALLGFCYYYFFAESGFEDALLIAVSVIVIACPCALALATPIASVVGLNVGFKNHIIYTKAAFLESLARASHIIFDKTGTLTESSMRVTSFQRHAKACEFLESCALQGFLLDSGDFLESKNFLNATISHKESTLHDIEKALLITLFQHNPHNIARAILEFAGNNKEKKYRACNIEIVAGKGFHAEINTMEFIGGSRAYMQELGIVIEEKNGKNCNTTQCFIAARKKQEAKEKDSITNDFIPQDSIMKNSTKSSFEAQDRSTQDSTIYDTNNDSNPYILLYSFSLASPIKPDSKELIALLQSYKKEIMILSGDNENAVKKVANALHITNYLATQTPLQKADFIQARIQEGHNVIMIGDGLNDSLALKYAQVGIAMGNGSEIALQYSDVIILDDSLKTLAKSFAIAHNTLSIIKQNLFMSLIYNACAIPLALCGYVIPLFAAAFMSVSSLCVVLNSLRLYKKRI